MYQKNDTVATSNFFSPFIPAPIKIAFIGLLGSGKSTASTELLKIMNRNGDGYELLSTDETVVSRMQNPSDPIILAFQKKWGFSMDEAIFTAESPTATFIERYGESRFRSLEAMIVMSLIEQSTEKQFFDLGGKVPLIENLSSKLKSKGFILVYLEVNADTIEARMSRHDLWKTRGIFKLAEEKGNGWRAAASKQREDRADKYRAIADIVIQADAKTPEEIVLETLKQLQDLELTSQKCRHQPHSNN